jgi:formylglycine-generating enzyme required for sulfatase activity
VTAVVNREEDGSGFTIPVRGLEDAMYNVRVVYSNPSDRDARLSLVADGPPRGDSHEDGYPYYIPVWFPPTARGRYETASFFWTLYAKTTFLTLEWQRGEGDHREWDDVGSVRVDAVELVKVERTRPAPARESVFPEMAAIPGGSFAMGSAEGEGCPDERLRHRVTLSPFAIGRYEVTNEEFERFMPGHANWRDGFSWRDSEPVIYVDWREAARYCNWLSNQAGLAPAYDEKTWRRDRSADGFRLPTEAEWECVASGRGEGRRYPWGDEEPDPTRGNFADPGTVHAVPAVLRSSEARGTTVVGSFPAGASRDGVMDLAGNVCEWCSDWYRPYEPGPQTDPCCEEESHSRAIRGGSWGYYGHSQRTTDREFNSQVYPGYVYIGFRVALPMESYVKLGVKVRAR